MKRGDWFFIFLSIAVVLIAVLGAITSYQNHTQSVTGPAIVITHAQSAVQVAPKRTTQK
jgi:hypothetical protein